MKILLHAPLHPSLWNYLMRLIPEHSWYIEPYLDFAEGSIPYSDLKFKVLPRKKLREKLDLQIICLHLTHDNIDEILETFDLPILWVEYWESSYKPKLPGIYPMISTSQTCHRLNYPDLRLTYPVPSSKLWNKSWIGDRKKVLVPSRQYYRDDIIKDTLDYLKKQGLPLSIAKTEGRSLPFHKWRNRFVHSRVLFEATIKRSSFTMLEAMSIGMPIVALPFYDNPKMIRNNIDGFIVHSEVEAYSILKRFIDDYSYAKEWGRKAKLRAQMIANPQKSREFWNKAFLDTISVYQKTGSWH